MKSGKLTHQPNHSKQPLNESYPTFKAIIQLQNNQKGSNNNGELDANQWIELISSYDQAVIEQIVSFQDNEKILLEGIEGLNACLENVEEVQENNDLAMEEIDQLKEAFDASEKRRNELLEEIAKISMNRRQGSVNTRVERFV